MDLFSYLFTQMMSNLYTSVSEQLFESSKGHFQNLAQLVFLIEERIGDITGISINNMIDLFFQFGVSLIILKFLYRGFMIYIVGIDGDDTASVEGLVLSFAKAIILAATFPILYDALINITMKLINDLGVKIQADHSNVFGVIDSLWVAVVAIVWLICYFIFRLQMVKTGVEMLILRIGFPLACVGLMDSDGGIFTVYSKKFFQIAVGVVVQITLVQLSISLALGGDPIISIAVLISALKAPNFLREFMLTGAGTGGGGLSSKIHAMSSLKRLLTKR